jgi:hypothetical protein
MPGFTLLRIYDVREWNEEVIHLNDDGLFLTNKTWKRVLFINDSGGQPQKRGLSTHCLALEGHLLYRRQKAWSMIPNRSDKHGPFIFNVLDDVHNHSGSNQWHYISSGSKAEGLNLPGSDYDVMFINKDINVYERSICITIVYKRIPKETYRTNCVQILLLFFSFLFFLAKPVLQITSMYMHNICVTGYNESITRRRKLEAQ